MVTDLFWPLATYAAVMTLLAGFATWMWMKEQGETKLLRGWLVTHTRAMEDAARRFLAATPSRDTRGRFVGRGR